jgi:5-methylcytosine-specific restriction endonuclease McrA
MKDKRKYIDRREELIRAVAKRRRKIKEMAIVYKGGKCQICGYRKFQGALDLHHLDPKTKNFAIGDKGYTRSWEKVRAELDKCVLLCANCHREIEGGVAKLPGILFG